MQARVLGSLAVVVFFVAPAALAQTPPAGGHVILCSRECAPNQVNDQNPHNVPVNVVLYAHLFDALQRAPLNVLPPDIAHEADVNAGFLTPTIRLREDLVYFNNSWFLMYHLPQFIDYESKANLQDGPLGYDLALGADEIKLYWYLSPHAVPQSNSSNTPVGPVGVMPKVSVSARIETGRHLFHGDLIAEGTTVAPVLVGLPGGDYAYEFEVRMKVRQSVIPANDGFVVGVNWYQVESGEWQVSQSDWRIRSGPRFLPRVIMPVANPMMLHDAEFVYRAGTHYVVTAIGSVFGGYDIYPYNLNMTFAEGPQTLGDPTPVFYFYNPLHPQEVKVVWSVPGVTKVLKAGEYRFQLQASNLQQTYELVDNATLSVVEFQSAQQGPAWEELSPTGWIGLTALAASLLAGAGFVLVRRLRKTG